MNAVLDGCRVVGGHPVDPDACGYPDAGRSGPLVIAATAAGAAGVIGLVRCGCVCCIHVVLGLWQGLAAACGGIGLGLRRLIAVLSAVFLALVALCAGGDVQVTGLCCRGGDGYASVRRDVSPHRRGCGVKDDADPYCRPHPHLVAGHRCIRGGLRRSFVLRLDRHRPCQVERAAAQCPDPGSGVVIGKCHGYRRAYRSAACRPGLHGCKD